MSTSKLQRHTGNELRARFAKYGIVENTRPDWLVSSKGERLELDFCLDRWSVFLLGETYQRPTEQVRECLFCFYRRIENATRPIHNHVATP